MKNHQKVGIGLLLVAAALFIYGCATFETNAYRTVGVSKATVRTFMDTWADMQVAGKTTPALDAQVITAYTNYLNSGIVAKMVIDGYRAGTNSQQRVDAVLIQVAANKELLRNLILSLTLPSTARTSVLKAP